MCEKRQKIMCVFNNWFSLHSNFHIKCALIMFDAEHHGFLSSHMHIVCIQYCEKSFCPFQKIRIWKQFTLYIIERDEVSISADQLLPANPVDAKEVSDRLQSYSVRSGIWYRITTLITNPYRMLLNKKYNITFTVVLRCPDY